MHLGSILNLIYLIGAIGGLFVLIGFFTLCWMLIVQIIKYHKRRMRALTEENSASQLNVPLFNSTV